MANKLKVLFWLHKSLQNQQGKSPLKIRLSYQGSRVDKSTGFYLKESTWNAEKQIVRGSGEEITKVNEWLIFTKKKINALFSKQEEIGDIHLVSMMQELFAIPKVALTLLNTIQVFNQQLKARVGKDYTFSTYEKYVITFDKVKAFITNHYKMRDVLLKDLTTKFIMEFDYYLRVNDKNQHNTAVKYCLNLKRIMNVCVLQGDMIQNPFKNYKTVYKITPQVYLDNVEVKKIATARLMDKKYILVRDLFLFQCYTGLSFTDLASLNAKDLSVDHSKNLKWIIKERQKTKVVSTIPLVKEAISVLQKYQTEDTKLKPIFPTYSIQKYNQYLAEIGDLIGLNKRLSSHVGRRTFGNVCLGKGISINVISKVLGHSNTLITQKIYAITTQNIIRNAGNYKIIRFDPHTF